MKSIKKVIAAMLFFITTGMTAQVSVDIHYGTPPVWAPAAPQVKYYYLPDIETYYDVPAQRYIYLSKGSWVRSATLPNRYRDYDLYHGRTVYLRDYRGNAPYRYYNQHKGNGNWKKNGHDNGNHNGNWKRKGHEKGHEDD